MNRIFCLVVTLVLALATPVTAGTARFSVSDSIGQNFGVQVKPWHTTDKDLSLIKAMGFGLVRWPIAWDAVEKRPGVYDWSESDAFFRRLDAAGLRSVIILGRGNPIYSGVVAVAPNLMSKEAASPAAPADRQEYAAFAAFAAAAARRYAGSSPIWEIWNEPDLDHFWPPQAAPDQYAALAVTACGAIKSGDRNAVVIGPGAAAMPGARVPIFQKILDSGASRCFDAISGHGYRIRKGQPMKTPESIQTDNLAARNWLADRGIGLTYLCSEWGYAEPLVSAQAQAAYPLRAHLSNLLSGVPLTIWYEWRDSKREPANPESHYGLLTYDGARKSGATALDLVLPKISKARLIRRVPLGDEGRYAVVVRQPSGQYGVVFWAIEAELGLKPTLRIGEKRVAMTAFPAYVPLGDQIPQITQ